MTMYANDSKVLAPLEALPLEIQEHIFSSLCLHCLYDPFDQYQPIDKIDRYQHLNALSLTSKRLRPLALSFLAHHPRFFPDIQKFIRALDDDPSLGPNVRELTLQSPGKLSEEAQGFYKKLAQKLLRRAGEDVDLEEAEGKAFNGSTLAMELLVVLTPNVDTLSVKVRDADFGVDGALKFLPRYLKATEFGLGFGNVTHLILEKGEDNFTPLSPLVTAFLNAATNLRSLRLVQMDENSKKDIGSWPVQASLQNLEILEIEECAWQNLEFLEKMIQQVPNLQRFRFEAANASPSPSFNQHYISPKQFLKALAPLQKNLKHLDLDLSEADYFQGSIVEGDLQDFTALETLKLSWNCFCECETFAENCLSAILPPTIKRVHVHNDSAWLGEIAQVAEKIQNGDLPVLEHIQIASLCDPKFFNAEQYESEEMISKLKALHKCFQGTGVGLFFSGAEWGWVKQQDKELSWMNMVKSSRD